MESPANLPARTRVLTWMAILTLGAAPLLLELIQWVDRPLARWLHASNLGGQRPFALLTDGFDWWYGHVFQVGHFPLGLILLGVGALGCWLWRRPTTVVLLLSLLLTHVAGKELVYHLKKWVSRPRPAAFLRLAHPGRDFGSTLPHADSFPSMHTVLVWSLMLPLALRYPRYRVSLLAGPVLISLGRLVLEAHYLSDVLFSMYLAAMLTLLLSLLYPRAARPEPAPVRQAVYG